MNKYVNLCVPFRLPARLGHIADHVEHRVLPLRPPGWIGFRQNSSSVDVVAVVEVVVVVHPVAEVSVVVVEPVGAADAAPDLLVDELIPVG